MIKKVEKMNKEARIPPPTLQFYFIREIDLLKNKIHVQIQLTSILV